MSTRPLAAAIGTSSSSRTGAHWARSGACSAHRRTASIPTLRERIDELERELATVNEVLESSRAQTRHLDERLMSSERTLRQLYASPSWQVTKPLRFAKRRLAKG